MIETRHPEMNALFGFAERQMHVVKRYWVWEVVWLFYSLVSVLSIGFLASGLGALGVEGRSFDLHRAQLYLLVGALLWGYLSLVFMETAFAISWERWEGTIEYTFMAPVRRVTHLSESVCSPSHMDWRGPSSSYSSRPRCLASTSRTPTSRPRSPSSPRRPRR
ncbi:MAG TPA: hypothetical protein VG426_04590 [Candidatus Dormibacteraeota bacterium]|jgi:hypothetical protein|nr:hypothetical protein [Candidatus Dormibacteraeota bacterium]